MSRSAIHWIVLVGVRDGMSIGVSHMFGVYPLCTNCFPDFASHWTRLVIHVFELSACLASIIFVAYGGE